jgi:cytochrome P450
VEIREVMSTTASCAVDGECESNLFSDIQRMKYVEMVVLETLRLHPSVPKEAKHCFQHDTLPDGTCVQSGDLLVFSPWCMGRNEALWTHALEFRPERFSDELKPNPYKFTAFQAGPRQCLGQTLAILEMKVVLFRLFQVFQFELNQPKESVTYVNTLTLPIKGGLQVLVKEL